MRHVYFIIFVVNLQGEYAYVQSAILHDFLAVCRDLSAFLLHALKIFCVRGRLLTEEVITMKNGKNIIAKAAKKAAERELRRDANQTSCVLFYQPKAPNGLNRFKSGKA